MADPEVSKLNGDHLNGNKPTVLEFEGQEKSGTMAHEAAEHGNAATDKYGNFKIPSIS